MWAHLLLHEHQNCKLLNNHWLENIGSNQKRYPFLRAKEKPQQYSRGGAFKIKTHTHQRCSEGTNKTLWTPGCRRKKQWAHKRLSWTCLWLFRSLQWRHGSMACQWSQELWLHQSWELHHAGTSPFGKGHHYPYHNFASGQTSGQKHSLMISRKLD